MGQYQQWLLYREVDQHLRAQLETLEAELAQLQKRVCLLERTCPQANNQIIHALAISLERAWEQEAPPNGVSHLDAAVDEREFLQVLSPSLQHWGALPDFSPQEMQESFQNGEESLPYSTPQPATPHSEMVLLPEDALAVFDEDGQTDPQLELPWWLRNVMASTGTLDHTSPIDQESIRTNRLVQRWLERWGRRPPSPTQQTTQEDDSHE